MHRFSDYHYPLESFYLLCFGFKFWCHRLGLWFRPSTLHHCVLFVIFLMMHISVFTGQYPEPEKYWCSLIVLMLVWTSHCFFNIKRCPNVKCPSNITIPNFPADFTEFYFELLRRNSFYQSSWIPLSSCDPVQIPLNLLHSGHEYIS